MLSKEDNQLITTIDRGTPMGDLFRRFWLPVLTAEELPVTDGRVGLLDAYCAHRGAPLFFGRNEESGLRCVYHGWKFDVDGVCVDLPSAIEGDTYREKIQIKHYPVVEAGEMIWAYMGAKEKQPPFPEFEGTDF